jgi:pimeloyl-ACP methyl ester carboxylesterase
VAASATVALAAPPALRSTVTGHGPAMILIPGLNSPAAVWNGVVDRFKDRFTCHAVSIPGFAGEPAAASPSLPAIRDAVLAYIDDNHLERPVIVGHSLGAVVAYWVAATAPQTVGPVVAVDGVPFLPALMNPATTVDAMRPQAEAMRAMLESASAEQRDRQSAVSLSSMITDPAQVELARRWAASSDPHTSSQLMMELMTTDLRSEMPKIQAPLLLIAAGGLFAAQPAARVEMERAYERQVAGVSNHKTIVATGARHFIMLDDLPFLVSAISEFLGSPAR